MNVWNLLNSLDAEIVSRLMEQFNISGKEKTQAIQDAVKTARKDWAKEQLPLLIGQENAERLLEQEVCLLRRSPMRRW